MKYLLILSIFSFIFLNEQAYSQPTATVQFIGGYSVPLGAYSGKFGVTRDQFTGNGNPDANSYFMKPGVNYGIFVKVPISKRSPFSIKGGIAFNVFGQTKEYIEGTGSITVTLKQSLFGITMGGEYDFGGRKSKVRPFAGAELSGIFFAGKYTEDYIDAVKTLTLNAAFRLGVNLVAGVDVTLHNNIGVLVGVKYSFANLIKKSFQADTRTKYNLNDASHTIDNINYPTRNITFLQLYGGISFYFGR